MAWNVYLAGEIHSDWRERIADGAQGGGPRRRSSARRSPITAASDDVGVAILGEESEGFWKDHKGAGVNAIRTQTLIAAGRCGRRALRRQVQAVERRLRRRLRGGARQADRHAPRPASTTHALKEIDRAAMATAETPEQVVDVLRYVLDGKLPARSA